MTVEREEPGLLVATCDGCGATLVLDLYDDETADQALEAKDWRRDRPEKVKFASASPRQLVVEFAQDYCPDCQDGTPKPAPRYGAHRQPQARIVGDDPVDEWPRALVFKANGLREACGHPPGDVRCSWCEEGYPIGVSQQWWRR